MPVLTDEDVGLGSSYLTDEDVGLGGDASGGDETWSPEEQARLEAEGADLAPATGFKAGLSRLRASEAGRALFGPTDVEREAGAMSTGSPGEIAGAALKFTTVPPQLANPIRTITDPAIEMLPPVLAGVATGVREVALSIPGPSFAAVPRLAMGAFTAQTIADLPEAKRAYEDALERGDTKAAAMIATQTVGNTAMLGLGAAALGPRRFTPPERGGISDPRQTTGEQNATTATDPARQQLDTPGAPTGPEAVLQEPGRKAQPPVEAPQTAPSEVQAKPQEGNAPQEPGVLLDKSKWTKATDVENLKAATPEQRIVAAQKPLDVDSFLKEDAEGFRAVDTAKLKAAVEGGHITGSPASDAMLVHLLKESDLHPLKSIRMLDFTPGEAQLLTGTSAPFHGRFSKKVGESAAMVELTMKRQNGEPISQAEFMETLTHEIVHNNITSKIRDATPEMQKDVNDVFRFVQERGKGTEFEKHNALTSVDELFAEISDPKVHKWLSELDYTGDIRKSDIGIAQVPAITPPTIRNSALGKFLEIAKKLLKLPDFITDAFGNKVETITALDQIVSLSSRLERVQRSGKDTRVNLSEAKAGDFKSAIKETEKVTNEELLARKGGATGFMWELGAKAKTAEDVAALKQAAEESSAKAKELMKAGDFQGAMAILGRQPQEAYEYATGVQLDGKPKWPELEKRNPGYKPSVPDAKYVAAKGETPAIEEAPPATKPAEAPPPPPAKPTTTSAPAADPVSSKTETSQKWTGATEEAPAKKPAAKEHNIINLTGSGAKTVPFSDGAYWQNKDGTLHRVNDHEGGASQVLNAAVDRQFTKNTENLIGQGWVRVVYDPAFKEINVESKAMPSGRQLAELKNLAIENGASLIWNSGTSKPRTIYEPPSGGLGGQMLAGIPNPAAVYRGIQKAVKDYGPSVKAAGKAVSDAVRDIYKENLSIRKMNDLDRSVLYWSAKMQRSLGESTSAQKEVQSVAKKQVDDEALSNWLEAHGDTATLTAQRDATTDPKLKAGYEAALHLTPEEKAMAQGGRDVYDQLWDRAERWGLVDKDPTKPSAFRDDYVTHIWNLGKGAFAGGARTLKDQFRFAKARTFKNYFEGEQAGFKPKTKRLSQLLPIYIHEMNSVIAAKQLVKQMWGGKASDGSPLLATRGQATPVSGAKGEAVLVRPDAPSPDSAKKGLDVSKYKELPGHSALHDWVFAGKDTAGNPIFEKSDLVLHPEAYKKLKAILGRSKIREWYETKTTATMEIPKAIVRGLDMYQSETKRTMFGLLAPFHQVQESWHGVGHRILPSPVTGGTSTKAGALKLPKPDLDNPEIYDMAKNGLMILPDRASEAHFMEGLRHSGLVSFIPGVGRVSDGYSKYLFGEVIPGMKIKTYAAALERNKGVYKKDLASGEVSLEDVKLLTATQVNAAYGHLNYADLGRDPTFQHILSLGLLAPDFLEARGRFFGQALKGLVPELGAKGERISGARGNKAGREQLYAMATLAAAQALVAYTAAQLVDGEWDGKHPFEMRKGNRKYTMRSVPEDAMRFVEDIRNVFSRGGEIPFISNRLNPITGRGPLQLLTGRDWRQQKVTPQETLKQLALAPIPLTARGFMGIDKSPLEEWEQLAGAAGLKIMNYSAQGEVRKMLLDWKKGSKDPRLVEQAEQAEAQTFAPSVYSDLRQALEKEDFKAAGKAYGKLLDSKTPLVIHRAMKPESMDPDTGTMRDRMLPKELEKRFLESLKDEEREVYEAAKRQRRVLYQRFQRMLAE